MPDTKTIADQIAEIYRTDSRRVLAVLVRLLGDLDLAEEMLQEAFGIALERWPQEGLPRNLSGWLVSTARHKGIDALRRRRRGVELVRVAALGGAQNQEDTPEWDDGAVRDDQLRLIFLCCHPALPIEARIALSLRMVCGLSTEAVARAFLVSSQTMKRRISRAKRMIRRERIAYEVPSRADLAQRLDSVLHVIYLVYNEGFAATAGARHICDELTREALFLARLAAELSGEPEALGLLALLVLHESRAPARVNAAGDVVALENQDRSLWDRDRINQGLELLRRAVMSGRVGPYTIQAAIASVHAAAESVEATNWQLVVGYYDILLALQPSPVVALNRAVAVGMRDGPRAGLAIVDLLLAGEALARNHLALAVKAELSRRAGLVDDAIESGCRSDQLQFRLVRAKISGCALNLIPALA